MDEEEEFGGAREERDRVLYGVVVEDLVAERLGRRDEVPDR